MDIGMDTGDMILKEETEIGEDETTGELWDRLSKMGAKLLVKTIEKIEQAKEQIEQEEDKNKQEKTKSVANNNLKSNNCENMNNNLSEKNETTQNDYCKTNNEILEKVKKIVGAEKQGENYTLAPMIEKEMAKIDWNKKSKEQK